MNDQTEDAVLQARIRSLESELHRVRAEFSTFSGRLSHDLQGIFRNIEGFASALQVQGGGTLGHKEAHYLDRIQAGARRGDSLMRDIALLSATAVAELRPSPLDLAGLVDDCIVELSSALEGRTMEWERAGAPWPRVTADPALLRLALQQLLANAVKFTRDRAPARVCIGVTAASGECEIRVADNGVGFDLAYGDRLFKAFERLHLPTEFTGNGVGLALVKTVVEHHGGRVHAAAPEEGGAVFTITLPQPLQDVAPTRSGPQPPPAAAEDGARGLRILVVDDDPLVLATIGLMLERDGHEVVAAAGGAAALRTLQQQPGRFDLVIADWLMPEVGGAEVVQAVKAAHPALPVIVLTGQRPSLSGPHDVPTAVEQVLDKPITPAKLRRAVAAVVPPPCSPVRGIPRPQR